MTDAAIRPDGHRLPTLEELRDSEVLSPLDHRFAEAMTRLAGDERPAVRLAAALASRAVRRGHVCLELPRWVKRPFEADDGSALTDRGGEPLAGLAWPEQGAWRELLSDCLLVGSSVDGDAATPLVLDPAGRLYLRRYWQHERELANALLARVAEGDAEIDEEAAREGLRRLFPDAPELDVHGQRVAALAALRRRLCVITGGPGTGKTTTVAGILTLLIEQARAGGADPPSVALLAPTGKAAARLTESIRRARERLVADEEVKAAIPDQAATIHRALGARPGSPTEFRHDATRPLPEDVVLVDEASMVDVALMRRLVQAVRPAARLILLGDKDQLASVEAGAVLGDICRGGDPWWPSAAFARDAEALAGQTLPRPEHAPEEPGIHDCVVQLTHSWRFGPDSGIGQLSRAINEGDAERALALLTDPDLADLRLVAPPAEPVAADATTSVDTAGDAHGPGERGGPPAGTAGPASQDSGEGRAIATAPDPRALRQDREHLRAHLGPQAVKGYAAAVTGNEGAADAAATGSAEHPRSPHQAIAERLLALSSFRILCAHRRGHRGVEGVNDLAYLALRTEGLLTNPGERFYAGRPIMITRNDYALDLFNGDVGLIVHDPRGGHRLVAAFTGPDDQPRYLAPSRLPPHETVFAMSIHKSQGSEFDEVAIVLPDRESPILSRELLYTAVTRARKRVTIYAGQAVLRAAIERRVERASGLQERLWGDG